MTIEQNCMKLCEEIKDYLKRISSFGWTVILIGIFLLIFISRNFLFKQEELENLFKDLYTLPLLSGLSCLGYFIFKLKKEKFDREVYYFLGVIVLLFTVIYCVSFLDFDTPWGKQAQKAAKESKGSAEESKGSAEKSQETAEKSKKFAEEAKDVAERIVSIIDLSNKAKWQQNNGGDYESYKKLLEMQKEIKNNELKKILAEQIDSIKNSYNAEDIWRVADSLPYICQRSDPPCAKGLEPIEGFNAKNVYDHLTTDYKLWPEHARAASLIRRIATYPNKNDMMFDVNKELVRLMGNENEKMMVRKVALETYKHLNQFHPKFDGVFDFSAAIEDWEVRKKEFQK